MNKRYRDFEPNPVKEKKREPKYDYSKLIMFARVNDAYPQDVTDSNRTVGAPDSLDSSRGYGNPDYDQPGAGIIQPDKALQPRYQTRSFTSAANDNNFFNFRFTGSYNPYEKDVNMYYAQDPPPPSEPTKIKLTSGYNPYEKDVSLSGTLPDITLEQIRNDPELMPKEIVRKKTNNLFNFKFTSEFNPYEDTSSDKKKAKK
jgi:hypothetical protein